MTATAREALIQALRAELENPTIYNPAFPDVADRILAALQAAGWAVVEKRRLATKTKSESGWCYLTDP